MPHIHHARRLPESVDCPLILDHRQAVLDVERIDQLAAIQCLLKRHVLVVCQVALGQVAGHARLNPHHTPPAGQMLLDKVRDDRDLVLPTHRRITQNVVRVQP